jgi:hypothetical protein
MTEFVEVIEEAMLRHCGKGGETAEGAEGRLE